VIDRLSIIALTLPPARVERPRLDWPGA
jgi:hypothetical protein